MGVYTNNNQQTSRLMGPSSTISHGEKTKEQFPLCRAKGQAESGHVSWWPLARSAWTVEDRGWGELERKDVERYGKW